MIKLKIPYTLIFHLIKNTEFLKAFCIYGKLKTNCGKKGFYFNYKSRKQELSDQFGISQNTLRKYISILKVKGFVWESNNNLRLANSHHIYKHFNISTSDHSKQIRLSYSEISPEKIIAEAFKLKQSQIEFKQKQNIYNILQNKVGIIKCNKIKKKVDKNTWLKVNQIYESKNKDNCYNYVKDHKEFGFLDNNMSSTTYSKMIGKKSSVSGFNIIKTLQVSKLAIVQPRSVKVEGVSSSQVKLLRKYSDCRFFSHRGDVYLRIPNRVTFK